MRPTAARRASESTLTHLIVNNALRRNFDAAAIPPPGLLPERLPIPISDRTRVLDRPPATRPPTRAGSPPATRPLTRALMRADKLGTVAAARREGEREKRVSYEFCLFWKIGRECNSKDTPCCRRLACCRRWGPSSSDGGPKTHVNGGPKTLVNVVNHMYICGALDMPRA